MIDANGVTPMVLVTGAGGFVGRGLAPRLAAAGYRVRAATRDPHAMPGSDRIEVVGAGDMAGPVDWGRMLHGVSHVVHLAGIAHATVAIPEATYMAVNAEATRSLAEAARANGLRRVVLMSSVRAQCGPCAAGVLTEADQPAPEDAYGRSKLQGERCLAEVLATGDCDWTVLRPVVVYGPGVKANMRALQRLAASPWPLPLGGLAGRRSLVGVDTLSDIVGHVLTSPDAARATFLAADPGPLTVAGIVAAMRAGLGRRPGVLHVPSAPARLAATLVGGGPAWTRLTGDLVVSTAALEATGWQPRETAAEGLARWMAGRELDRPA